MTTHLAPYAIRPPTCTDREPFVPDWTTEVEDDVGAEGEAETDGDGIGERNAPANPANTVNLANGGRLQTDSVPSVEVDRSEEGERREEHLDQLPDLERVDDELEPQPDRKEEQDAPHGGAIE